MAVEQFLSPQRLNNENAILLPANRLHYRPLSTTNKELTKVIARMDSTSMVNGMGNVDNIRDIDKCISTLTQAALDLKAPIESPTFTGTVGGITKAMVGLPNVDNTSDVNKIISNLTQAALDLKAPINNPTFTGTVGGITKSMVGLPNVDNTTDLGKPVSNATQAQLDLKPSTTWVINAINEAIAGITKDSIGLGNVQNYSPANMPLSTAATNALAAKAPLANPSFTGTVTTDDRFIVGDSYLEVNGLSIGPSYYRRGGCFVNGSVEAGVKFICGSVALEANGLTAGSSYYRMTGAWVQGPLQVVTNLSVNGTINFTSAANFNCGGKVVAANFQADNGVTLKGHVHNETGNTTGAAHM